jgi:hypothetical protein
MVVKLTKKMLDIPFECDSCGIGIGVSYETKDWDWVGASALCPACYRDIMEDKYLYINDGGDYHVVMFLDGTKQKVTREELEKLRSSCNSKNFTISPY